MSSTSFLYHGFKMRNCKYVKTEFKGGSIIMHVVLKTHTCAACNSNNITLETPNRRIIQVLPIGMQEVYVELDIYRANCKNCKSRETEQIDFLSHKKARISKALERMLCDLRTEMTINGIERKYNIDWRTIKNCEKEYLKKKHKKPRLKYVTAIGIDEIYVCPKTRKYITIVRDLNTGAVLFIGEGRNKKTLEPFTKSLKHSKANIQTIAMDMSGPFKSWAKEFLPNAEIVFDHFHVIKLMNDKVNAVRILTMKELNEKLKEELTNNDDLLSKTKELQEHLTGQKYLFLKAEERLKKDKLEKLISLREMFGDLGEISLMKEYLRGIYSNVSDPLIAEGALIDWCEIADVSSIKGLHQMAKTIRNHMAGIVAFWSTSGITNASMEGFNCKIRCLIKQAYGYRDMEYFYLKIFDLPARKIKQVI
jgi:transposase